MSMNITPHIPQVVVNASSPPTEALTRDNLVKEVVPAPVATEGAVPQKSREQDSRPPVNQQPTYDDIRQEQNNAADVITEQDEQDEQQNPQQQAQDDSGQQDAENQETRVGAESENDSSDAEQEQIEAAEQQQIRELQARDAEVRAHEQAHAAIGGAYAGAPSYQYQTGPDGKKYAVGGEVSIDVSKTSDPEQTIRKMQTVRAAALAPAEPSAQDRKVALEATQNIAEARADMIKEVALDSQQAGKVELEQQDDESPQLQTVNIDDGPSHPAKMELAGQQESNESGTSDFSGQQSLANERTAQVVFNRYHTSYKTEETGFTAVA